MYFMGIVSGRFLIGIVLGDGTRKIVLDTDKNSQSVSLRCISPDCVIIPIIATKNPNPSLMQMDTIGTITLRNLSPHNNRLNLNFTRADGGITYSISEMGNKGYLAKNYFPLPSGKKQSASFSLVLIMSGLAGVGVFVTFLWLILFKKEYLLQILTQFMNFLIP